MGNCQHAASGESTGNPVSKPLVTLVTLLRFAASMDVQVFLHQLVIVDSLITCPTPTGHTISSSLQLWIPVLIVFCVFAHVMSQTLNCGETLSTLVTDQSSLPIMLFFMDVSWYFFQRIFKCDQCAISLCHYLERPYSELTDMICGWWPACRVYMLHVTPLYDSQMLWCIRHNRICQGEQLFIIFLPVIVSSNSSTLTCLLSISVYNIWVLTCRLLQHLVLHQLQVARHLLQHYGHHQHHGLWGQDSLLTILHYPAVRCPRHPNHLLQHYSPHQLHGLQGQGSLIILLP